jgi:uncharacterized protein (TIGR00251 family)
VQSRAARTEIAGLYASALKVRLRAPPVDGAANEALVEFLAGKLGVARRAVSIVAGHSSRAKTVQVDGVTAAGVMALAEGAGSE